MMVSDIFCTDEVTSHLRISLRKGDILCCRLYPNLAHEFLSLLKFEKSSDTDIYEFGVFSGESVKIFLEKVPEYCFDKIWGFDSFEGLPFCDAEPLHQEGWSKGNFDSRKFTNTDTPEAASKRIEEILSNDRGCIRSINVIYID
jgi:hypothetical protein